MVFMVEFCLCHHSYKTRRSVICLTSLPIRSAFARFDLLFPGSKTCAASVQAAYKIFLEKAGIGCAVPACLRLGERL